METKTCYACKRTLSVEEFHKKGDGRRRAECQDCRKIFRKKWNRLHRSNTAKINRKQKMRLKSLWQIWLKENNHIKCSICGYNKCQAALEWHHLNPGEKEARVAGLRSVNKKISEIIKCVLVCANCHREIHHMGPKDEDTHPNS